jgi:4-amino-4-deoxy-L-arabinose transferase-like glycosyltransferase
MIDADTAQTVVDRLRLRPDAFDCPKSTAVTLPYDSLSLVALSVALSLTVVAWSVASSRTRVAVGAIVLAGCVLRMDSAWQRPLHHWDERFHALVAKNLIADPLKPTLYRSPAIEYDYRDWTGNHIWLHKPPFALWSMAASMWALGVDATVMRLPSVVWSTATILLTFAIGAKLFDRRTALLASTFLAFNGFLIALASGRRVADHVDTALILWFALSVWLALARSRSHAGVVLCGVAVGCAFLSKSFPALLALPVIVVAMAQELTWKQALRRTAASALIAILVALPWTIYIWTQWPAEAEWELAYTLRHVSQTLEGANANPFAYARELPRFFGELTPVSLALAAVWLVRRSVPPAMAVLIVWIALPYGLFSTAITRMPGFVMISAPAIVLVHAYVWWRLRDVSAGLSWPRRTALGMLLAIMVLLPIRYLLEPTGPLERRDRWPASTELLRTLEARLGLDDAVIFNMPNAIEAMFYSPYTVYEGLPSEAQVRQITKQGRPILIYPSDNVANAVPSNWPTVASVGRTP